MHQVSEWDKLNIVFGKDEFDPEKTFGNFEGVAAEIERRTISRVGNTKNVSDKPIVLDIYSPDYPDLQFTDLPGFTRTTVMGQSGDICQQIEDLNIPIIKGDNTIILAIQDATQDIAMSTALEMALREDIDPEGRRTIGVLTKLDNLTAMTDKDRVVKVIKNETKPLAMGYFGVVNRSQDAIDKGDDVDQTRDIENSVIQDPAFLVVRNRLGIKQLRNFISQLLAHRMEEIMPELRQKANEDMNRAKEGLKEHGSFDDTNAGKDDLISKLVEISMERIRTNLYGLSTNVAMDAETTGAQMNILIKDGALSASQEARRTYSVDDFLQKLIVCKRNVTAIRDGAFPEGLVLEIGVGLLTECFRKPLMDLLDKSCKFLTKEISVIFGETLGIYPEFEKLVTKIALDEVEENRKKAEEYLNVQIDIHRRFVNCDHSEFVKMKEWKKKTKHKNHFDLWFKEQIPNAKDNNPIQSKQSKSKESNIELEDPAEDAKKVRGFYERLQNNDGYVKSNKFPSGTVNEAMLHLDLCLEYMEIVDKALMDEIPKIFIMMLCHKFLDFLKGGEAYPTSFLRKVQEKVKDSSPDEVLVKSFEHEEIIKDWKNKISVAERTIEILDQAQQKLTNLKCLIGN